LTKFERSQHHEAMDERETINPHQSFPTSEALGKWMADNHARAKELWVRIYKSASGKPSVAWTDCVVEAIRYGWIDGQKKPLDGSSFLQRLSPRKPGSNWSSRNREHAKKLIEEGRMTSAGLAQVEAAKKDGRWEKAYAGSAEMEIPEDFLTALNKLPKAKKFFATLSRQNLFSIYYRLQSAKKPETRVKRMAQILSMLENETKFH
jgi:uncharacterized protein YdeI (YjbR/CyaY-like superfamily)